jgi:hypothetical protein
MHQCINASMHQGLKPPNYLDLSALCRIVVREVLDMLMQQERGWSRCRGSAIAVDGDEIMTNVCRSSPARGGKHPRRTQAAEVTTAVEFVVDSANPVNPRQSQSKHVRCHSLPPFQP